MSVLVKKTYFTTLINFYNLAYRNIRKKAFNEEVVECFHDIFNLTELQILRILDKNPRINTMTRQYLTETVKVLENFGINKMITLDYPSLLSIRPTYLKNHGKILLECGFTEVKPDHLVMYHSLLKKNTIDELKQNEILPENIDVYKSLLNCFTDIHEIPYIKEENENGKTLLDLRLAVMQKFLEYKLDMTPDIFLKAYRTYNNFHSRPLSEIEQSLKIACDEIGFSPKRIFSYPFVVAVDPSNTLKILNDPNCFDDIDACEMINTSPAIIRINYLSILKITAILKDYRIPAYVRKRAGLIYTLNEDTLKTRLSQVKDNKVLEAFSVSPRYLLLVLYKNKVESRINTLEKSNKKCSRSQLLLQKKEQFENYIKSDTDKNGKLDVLHLISQLFDSEDLTYRQEKSFNIIRLFSRHPQWLYVPIVSIMETMIFLKQHFSNEEILNNFYILLYSKEVIEKCLSFIRISRELDSRDRSNFIDFNAEKSIIFKTPNSVLNLNFDQLTNNQLLSLILYIIEKEYFYTGEGIWNNRMLASNT